MAKKVFKMTGIYIIKNIVNGKCYVGSAVNFKRRWNEHKSTLRRNIHRTPALQNAWNKYGEQSFEFISIQFCNSEDLIKNEQFWIDYMDSYNSGYNCKPNAQNWLGKNHTEYSKQKISESKKGKISNRKGCKHTEESKKLMSISKIGVKRGPYKKK